MVHFKRFLLFYAVWLVVSEARADLLALGLTAALLAAALSRLIWRRTAGRVSLFAVLAYLPGFLWRSWKGGLDVAWRVFHPRLPIAPAFLVHDTREPDETGRVLLTDVLSLMPGTLAAGLGGRRAIVHLLADEPATRRLVDEEDRRIAGLYTGEPDGEARR